MSLLASFQSGLKEACLDYRDCYGLLIITCSSLLLLICSAQCTHRWILMPWRMIAVCVCPAWTHTDRCRQAPKVRTAQARVQKRRTRAVLRALRVLPSETAEPPLRLRAGKKAASVARTETHKPPCLALYQQQKEGKRKESVLSEINREIIP